MAERTGSEGGKPVALDPSEEILERRESPTEEQAAGLRGEGGRTRTYNQRIKSPMLYH